MFNSFSFNSQQLGKKASERLRNISGRFVTFTTTNPGVGRIKIYLDNNFIGEAEIKEEPKKVWLSDAIKNDEINKLSGYDTTGEHEVALRRIGFNQYQRAFLVCLHKYWETEEAPLPQQPIIIREYIRKTIEKEKPTSNLENIEEIIDRKRFQLEKEQRENRIFARKLEEQNAELEQERMNLIRERRVLKQEHNGIPKPVNIDWYAEGLRKSIADMIVKPIGGIRDMRVWQLRIASQILSSLNPHLKYDLRESTKNWLHPVSETEEIATLELVGTKK